MFIMTDSEKPSSEAESRVVPVVLVTGASRGLGRGIALELAQSGFSVAVHFNGNADAARETVALCQDVRKEPGQQFRPFQANLADKEQRSTLTDRVLEVFGRIDGLVNNAGMAPRVRADITEATEESFEEVIRTNLQGPYFLTQRVVRYWLSGSCEPVLAGGFKIVFVTSISSHTASTNRGEYCLSKAGLSTAAQLWAVRLAGEGIQVFEVRPGIMKTDMTEAVRERYDLLIAEGLVPQKRWGTPEDVGRAVRAIFEGNFDYSTGTVIDVDGGFHLRSL